MLFPISFTSLNIWMRFSARPLTTSPPLTVPAKATASALVRNQGSIFGSRPASPGCAVESRSETPCQSSPVAWRTSAR